VLQNMLERKRENAPRWDCSDELSWRSMPSWAQVSAPIGCVYFEEHHTDNAYITSAETVDGRVMLFARNGDPTSR